MAGSNRRKRGRSRGHGNGNGGERSSSNGGQPRCEHRVHEMCTLGPFAVFCAYHLGITQDERYSEPDPHRVARHFGMTPEELDAYLEQHRLTVGHLKESDFDIRGAREDIRVAPSGISRVELARTMYAEVRGEEPEAETREAASSDTSGAYTSK